MPQQKKNAKDKLDQLAEYLRHGWKPKYPVQEEDFAKLQDKMREIWKDKEHDKTKEIPNELTKPANEDKVQGRELGQWPEEELEHDQSQDQDQDNEHDNDRGQEHER